MSSKPSQKLAHAIVLGSLLFAAWYIQHVLASVDTVGLTTIAWSILATKTLIELGAGVYAIAFLAGAIAYLFMRDGESQRQSQSPAGCPVGLVYLCCDDVDRTALMSLTRLTYDGPLILVIHDDSRGQAVQAEVDAIAQALRSARVWDVRVLRRGEKTGGKAAAVNYVLEQTGHLFDYFLLCDNDSTVLDPDTVGRALDRFDGPNIAIVQCRTVHVMDPHYCPTNRLLAQSISAFHAFLAPAARFGWMPFIGHNAFLRTSAVRGVGGLTPDFFSDDLDLTVRLNLRGFRVVYAPEIAMGEKHPPSYAAFRKRSYKWAYGCIQTLRAHWRSVLTSSQFTVAEKLSFFQFAGFYCLQCILLAYLALVLLAIPLGAMGLVRVSVVPNVLMGSLLMLLVYAPLLSYYARAPRRERGWVRTVVLCGLIYGGTDFAVFRGVVDALSRRKRRWIPTNQVSAAPFSPALFAEAGFGLLLLAVPLAQLPQLFYLPCWYLFAGKFLFTPALSLLYRDEEHDKTVPDISESTRAAWATRPAPVMSVAKRERTMGAAEV
jgi:hypothetical protein